MDAAPQPPDDDRRGPTLFGRLKRWAAIVALGYLGACLVIWSLQRRMIYQAGEPISETEQLRAAEVDGLAPWHDEQGRHLGWRRERPDAWTIVVCHGNAGTAAHRVRLADGLSRAGWSVYLLEYPGYGGRRGTPSRRSLVEAGGDAVDRLAAARGDKVFLLGESIGSGVACAVAAARPTKVAGLLLVTPFARVCEVGRHHLPYLPVGLLMGAEDYDNRAALAAFAGPTAFLIAGRDEVVTTPQGRDLHAACAGPKRLWEQPDATHNTLNLDPGLAWWRVSATFLRTNAR